MQKRPSLEEQKWERVWGKKRGGHQFPHHFIFPQRLQLFVCPRFLSTKEKRAQEKKNKEKKIDLDVKVRSASSHSSSLHSLGCR